MKRDKVSAFPGQTKRKKNKKTSLNFKKIKMPVSRGTAQVVHDLQM